MDLIKQLSQSLSAYNKGAFTWITSVLQGSTLKTGLYLMGIILLLEFAGIFERANTSNGGLVTYKMFQGIFFRFVWAGLMVAASTVILQFILLISNGLVTLFGVAGGDTLKNIGSSLPQLVMPKAKGFDFMSFITGGGGDDLLTGILATAVLAFISIFIQFIAYLAIQFLLVLRFFQLYVLYIFSPIPMASFASSKYQNIGENYLKLFAAYCFQSVVIIGVLGIYKVFSSVVIQITSGFGGEFAAIQNLGDVVNGVVNAVVFVVVLVGSLRISKHFFGIGL